MGCTDIPAGATITILPSVGADIDYIELSDSTCTTNLPLGAADPTEALARQLETESIVLAQNNHNILPLDKNQPVAVFGRGQLAPTTGGNGSGAVTGAYTSTFVDGMQQVGARPFAELLDLYKSKVKSFTDIDHGWNKETEYPGEWGKAVYSGTTWSMTAGTNTPDVKLDGGKVTDDGIVARAREYADKAIVFITRTTGAEEMDRIQQNGDWYLDPSERVLLRQVTDKFDEVIVILSTIGPIDMSWVKEYDIDAVMISYAAGSQNGYALADLVFGVENPSGKLADTITETYEEHPTADTFGYTSYADVGLSGLENNTRFGDDDPVSTYLEGIYNGHRYFDTFGKNVLYPFGSGLSYSDFEFSKLSVALDRANKAITVKATITNASKDQTLPAGKEVMEVYVSAPQGKLEQPYQKLVDFEKTDALKAGAQQTVECSIPLKAFASYSEEKAAYVLEAGYYDLRVGGSSRDTHVAGSFYVSSEIMVEQLENRLTLSADAEKLFEEKALSNADATPITYDGEAAELAAARKSAVRVTASMVEVDTTAPEAETLVFPELGADEPVYKWSEVASGNISMEKFVAQLTEDELLMMTTGNIWHGLDTAYYSDDPTLTTEFNTKTTGITGCGVTRSIERLAIPSIVYADGSAGIGYNVDGKRNIGWPRAAALACVWNKTLLAEYATTLGQEMLHINCDVWLAPSINLHRNPLCGRNNEYYSEDPVLSGIYASIVAKGVAQSGVTVCLKHFAANDQEYYRRGHYNKSTESSGSSKDAINILSTERALREITLKPFQMAVETGDVRCIMSAFNKINGEYAASSVDLLTHILDEEWGFTGFVVTDWGEADAIAHAGDMMIAGVDQIERGDHQMYTFADQIRERLADGRLDIQRMRENAYDLLSAVRASALSSMAGKHTYRNQLTLLTTALPAARSNYEYSLNKTNPLIAAGGSGSNYTFAVAADSPDALPVGMTLSKNGRLSGKPSSGQEGEYSIKFTVRDNTGAVASKLLKLTVNGELSFAPETLPVVLLDRAYSAQLAVRDADGNAVQAIYTLDGALPKGLHLSADGRLSGTCKEIGNGSYTFTVSASSKTDHKRGSATFTLRVIESEVEIQTAALKAVNVDERYSVQLKGEGGFGAYTWSAAALPAGFMLDGDTLIYGYDRDGVPYQQKVPAACVGVYQIELTVTDELGTTDTKAFTLTVGSPKKAFAIATGSLPHGKAGGLYNDVQLATVNGDGAVTFATGDGCELPQGMQLSADGVLSGTPSYTDAGEHKLIVTATDAAGHTDTATYTLYIAGSLQVDPAPYTVLTLREGISFGKQFRATGGIVIGKKYELHESSDPLPAGLTFTANNSRMAITGTPERGSAGTYHLVVLMDDEAFSGNPVTTVVPYTLIIEPYAENVALNKTAVGSSYHLEDDPPLHPQDTVDGDRTTRWCSDWQNGDVDRAWLTVDLGEVYEICEIFIAWEPAYAAEYTLLVSDDGVSYTPVEISWANKDGLNHTFLVQASGRYVKMQSIRAATQYGSSIYEFEVYSSVQSVHMGDVDGDGNINASDIIKLKNLIMAGAWTPEELSAGDMNNSGNLDVADIIAVKNQIMGM